MTLANGSASPSGSVTTDAGGAIVNRGTLAVLECALTGNTAIYGGAISNAGTLNLVDSTLSGNSASSYGGAVYSTGSVTLTDCTISGNSAGSVGGGIYRSGYSQPGTSLTLADCTISGNSALLGGGIVGFNVTMSNTIVANRGSGGDIRGIVSGSNNLVDDAATAGGLVDGADGNLVGDDPRLGELAYNGGPTPTLALLSGSNAIGEGDSSLLPSGVTTDQRGFGLHSPRPDIGAFQYQGPPPTGAITVSGSTTQPAQTAFTFTLTATDPTPADRSATFTYTIDWNGDGSDIQTIQGPASLQVAHAYNAAGSYTPIVTVLDHDNRSSSPAALAAPVVVTAASPPTLSPI